MCFHDVVLGNEEHVHCGFVLLNVMHFVLVHHEK